MKWNCEWPRSIGAVLTLETYFTVTETMHSELPETRRSGAGHLDDEKLSIVLRSRTAEDDGAAPAAAGQPG